MFCILLIPRQVPSRARMVETFAAAGDGSNSVTRQKFWLWSHGPKSQHFLQVLPPSAAIENQSWGLLPSAAWHWSAPWRPKRIWIVVGFKPCCLAEACATSVRWMRELKGFSNHRIFSQSYLVVFSCAMLCLIYANSTRCHHFKTDMSANLGSPLQDLPPNVLCSSFSREHHPILVFVLLAQRLHENAANMHCKLHDLLITKVTAVEAGSHTSVHGCRSTGYCFNHTIKAGEPRRRSIWLLWLLVLDAALKG